MILIFLAFGANFISYWIRSSIRNADPDPGDKSSADPDPKHCLPQCFRDFEQTGKCASGIIFCRLENVLQGIILSRLGNVFRNYLFRFRCSVKFRILFWILSYSVWIFRNNNCVLGVLQNWADRKFRVFSTFVYSVSGNLTKFPRILWFWRNCLILSSARLLQTCEVQGNYSIGFCTTNKQFIIFT
jgi:hypothetical protein